MDTVGLTAMVSASTRSRRPVGGLASTHTSINNKADGPTDRPDDCGHLALNNTFTENYLGSVTVDAIDPRAQA